jgi:hypothetical protein
MKFLLHKEKKWKPNAHSGTFGCPNARAAALQPKEPSFCLRTKDIVNINESSIYFSIFTRL